MQYLLIGLSLSTLMYSVTQNLSDDAFRTVVCEPKTYNVTESQKFAESGKSFHGSGLIISPSPQISEKALAILKPMADWPIIEERVVDEKMKEVEFVAELKNSFPGRVNWSAYSREIEMGRKQIRLSIIQKKWLTHAGVCSIDRLLKIPVKNFHRIDWGNCALDTSPNEIFLNNRERFQHARNQLETSFAAKKLDELSAKEYIDILCGGHAVLTTGSAREIQLRGGSVMSRFNGYAPVPKKFDFSEARTKEYLTMARNPKNDKGITWVKESLKKAFLKAKKKLENPIDAAAYLHFRLMYIQPFDEANYLIIQYFTQAFLGRAGIVPPIFWSHKEYTEVVMQALIKNDYHIFGRYLRSEVCRTQNALANESAFEVLNEKLQTCDWECDEECTDFLKAVGIINK